MGKCINKILELHKQGKIPNSTIIKMAAFFEEINKVAQKPDIKVKSLRAPRDLKSLGIMLLMGAALGGGAYAFTKGVDVITKKLDERNKEPLFQEMLRLHPELVLEDQKRIRQYFETVWHFSPHLAKNPFAAGAYIRHAMSLDPNIGGPSIASVKDITSIQKDVSGIEREKPGGISKALFYPMALTSEQMVGAPTEITYGADATTNLSI